VDKNHLQYGIGYPAKLARILPQFLFRTFAVFNVGAAAIPVDDRACLVAKGNRADQEPSNSPSKRRKRASISPGAPEATID
jgi:hypothetical protein